MKQSVGVFAALLLVTTVALGQQYQTLPFPQAANPVIANGTAEKTSPSVKVNVPFSMAVKTTKEIAPSRNQFDSGSPFPSAANPSLANGAGEEKSLSSGHLNVDNGSPFPSAANPSKN